MSVRRRHVMYVPGYDPRGLAHYFRIFRQEVARFAALHGLRATVSRPVSPRDAASCHWVATTAGPDWEVETTYEFMRWDDVVRADARRPAWRTIGCGWLLLARYVGNGMYRRLARAHWRFAAFFAYPFAVLVLLTVAAALLGVAAAALLEAAVQALLPVPPPSVVAAVGGAAVAIAALVAALRLTESRTYVLYLLDDALSTDEYARRRRPDWEARLALFAERLVAMTRAAETDEIVVVGHSSGSFMAVDVLAQALAQDPALGRHGPQVRLLTLGANLPLVGFNPAAGWFIERLRRVLDAPALAWIDVQSRKDVMSFYPFDQAAGHGLAGPNLTTVPLRFRDVVLPQHYAAFRWRFFRMHFQYLMASERPAAWDYFMLICGRSSLSESAATLPRAR